MEPEGGDASAPEQASSGDHIATSSTPTGDIAANIRGNKHARRASAACTWSPTDYNRGLLQSLTDKVAARGTGPYEHVASAAKSLTQVLEAVRCHQDAAQLLGLRLQEVLAMLVSPLGHTDNEGHKTVVEPPNNEALAQLCTLLNEACAFVRVLSRPGYLPVLLSGRGVREGWEAQDAALLHWIEARQPKEEEGALVCRARGYGTVVNAQAQVLEWGGLGDVAQSEQRMNQLAQAIQATLTDLQAEVSSEVAAIGRDVEALAELATHEGTQAAACPLTHPGFRRLWLRYLRHPLLPIPEFMAKLGAFMVNGQGMEASRVEALLGDVRALGYLGKSLDLDGWGHVTPAQLHTVLRPLSHLESVYQATSFLIGQRGRRVLLPGLSPELRCPMSALPLPTLPPLLSSPGLVQVYGPEGTGKSHTLLSLCHELSRTDALQGDVVYLDANSAIGPSATQGGPQALAFLLSAQLGLTVASLDTLPSDITRLVNNLSPGSVIVLDHVHPPPPENEGEENGPLLGFLQPLHDALLARALPSHGTGDVCYVLLSREPLPSPMPSEGTAGVSCVRMPLLTDEQSKALATRLLPHLFPSAHLSPRRPPPSQPDVNEENALLTSLCARAKGQVGTLLSLGRLPRPVMDRLLRPEGEGMEIREAVLASLSGSQRDFVCQLGPLFALHAPFEDKLALTLLGQGGMMDALERADMWFTLLTLGLASRTDEGLFRLHPAYASVGHTRPDTWQVYYRYWADKLQSITTALTHSGHSQGLHSSNSSASVRASISASISTSLGPFPVLFPRPASGQKLALHHKAEAEDKGESPNNSELPKAAESPKAGEPAKVSESPKNGESASKPATPQASQPIFITAPPTASEGSSEGAAPVPTEDGSLMGALSSFDRWRAHLEALLHEWEEGRGEEEAMRKVAGQVGGVLRHRLPKPRLLRLLDLLAKGVDAKAHPHTRMRARNDQVSVLLSFSDFSAALPPAEEAVSLSRDHALDQRPTELRACLLACAQLGKVYEALGRVSEAAALYEHVVSATRRTLSNSPSRGNEGQETPCSSRSNEPRKSSIVDARLGSETAARLQLLRERHMLQDEEQIL